MQVPQITQLPLAISDSALDSIKASGTMVLINGMGQLSLQTFMPGSHAGCCSSDGQQVLLVHSSVKLFVHSSVTSCLIATQSSVQ